ncbi:MAG: response regulator [Acidobacteria bacterium]|nr:response regulator [Acidobacteriota bacterium]
MKNQLRILCADDEDTCELLTTTLGFSNIEVKSAHTVADAWRLAQTEPFDLYLLETRLPDGDGFDLCRRLRQFAPRAPIVFYSTAAYPIDRQKGLAAGANDYLTKPYLGDLAVTIRQNIEQIKNPVWETEKINIQTLPRMTKHGVV